jgi:hypothetical protein
MKKLLGLLVIALNLSVHSLAFGQDDAPPFSTLVCESESLIVKVKIQHYRRTNGAGPALINGNGEIWWGGWSWKAAPEGTRLTGFYFLDVKGGGSFFLKTLYNGIGLSGGWLEMSGFSGPVNCKIDKV